MQYLLFSNDIYVSDGGRVKKIEQLAAGNHVFDAIDKANICVVDTDVRIIVAPELPIEKKDSILVRNFKEFYKHEEYVIQEERIGNNLFQVVGITERKIKEIYSLIKPEKVESLIPYGLALRNCLNNKKVDLIKITVFIDDLGSKFLLTVFEGLKFSRTRDIAKDGNDLLTEVKRSQIDFSKKLEKQFDNQIVDYQVFTNSNELAEFNKANTENIKIEFIDLPFPGIEGLKDPGTSINFRLPEEGIKKRKDLEFKRTIGTSILSLFILGAGILFFGFTKIEYGLTQNQADLAKQTNDDLSNKLLVLDQETYRRDLKVHKDPNFGIVYLSIIDNIPASYQVQSFHFVKSGEWTLELTLGVDDGMPYDPIPAKGYLRRADVKDVFVNKTPGKHIRVTL